MLCELMCDAVQVERLLDERERSVVRARRSPLYCIAQLLYCAAGWPRLPPSCGNSSKLASRHCDISTVKLVVQCWYRQHELSYLSDHIGHFPVSLSWHQ